MTINDTRREWSTVCTLDQFARLRGCLPNRACRILRTLVREGIAWRLRRGVYRVPTHLITGVHP